MKIRLSVYLLLLVLAIGCSSPVDKDKELERVNQLVNTGRISDAIQASTALIARYPNDPRFYYIRGFCHLRQKSVSAAQADFESCIRIDPKYYGGYKGMASVYSIKGMYEEAEKQYMRAHDLTTTDEEKSAIMQNIATMYSAEIKDQKKAIDFFNKSIRLNDLGDWHFGLALAYYRDGRKEEALNVWMKAVNEKRFKNVYFKHAAYYHIAEYWREKKNYAQAKSYIKTALQLDPDNALYTSTSRDIDDHLKTERQ